MLFATAHHETRAGPAARDPMADHWARTHNPVATGSQGQHWRRNARTVGPNASAVRALPLTSGAWKDVAGGLYDRAVTRSDARRSGALPALGSTETRSSAGVADRPCRPP